MTGCAADATLALHAQDDGARRPSVSVAAAVLVAGDDGSLEPTVPGEASFLGPLVERVHLEFGVERTRIRRLATEVLATFATARVQAFVPILVEKQLRQMYRRRNGRVAPLRV
jgi:hypothetical protein